MAKGNLKADLKFEELSTYDDVLDYLNKKKRPKHLIIGNGHSIAYDHEMFSYNALFDFIEELEDEALSKLFSVINTKNFEQVMKELDRFIQLAQTFDNTGEMVKYLKEANSLLQESLIEAISELHPEHVFKISDESAKKGYEFFAEFLDNEGKLFSTNYDLLLYWVLMRNRKENATDGFGKEHLNPQETKKGEDAIYDDLKWGKHKYEQNVFYLHGTLPIFNTGIDIEKEIYTTEAYLLENIKERMNRKEYPIFVTAGDGEEKLKQIYRNRYLTFCYEELSEIQGSLISFGFNFGSYDEHIIEAINKAAKWKYGKDAGVDKGGKLFSIYIGVYSESDLEHIKEIQGKFDCKVNVYNAQTANVWG